MEPTNLLKWMDLASVIVGNDKKMAKCPEKVLYSRLPAT
jgi:hypothetical protein